MPGPAAGSNLGGGAGRPHSTEKTVTHRARQSAGHLARGFTLIELSIAIVIIGVLAAALLVAAGRFIREARVAGERQFLVSLRVGVEQFRQQFGFLPPLVQDGPPDAALPGNLGPILPRSTSFSRRPAVRDDSFLRYDNAGTLADQPRWSQYSLPYYLMGLLDADDDGTGSAGPKPIDGVTGPNFTAPQPDGSFLQRGPSTPPFVDPSRGRNRVYRADPTGAPEKVVITDRWGNTIRYYRWLPRHATTGANADQVDQYMVPRAVGDPNTTQELRSATFAIVSIGPDNLTDERRPLPTAGRTDQRVDAAPRDDTVKDDIVEVGR